MKIASQTEYISARINDYEAVRMVCEAGFDALDFSMFHMKNDDCPLNSDSYKDIVKELKLRENKKCVVNEEDKEIFIIRSDGMFVMAHDFNCSSERVNNIPEWFVKNHIEKRLVDFVNQTQK